NLWKCPSSSSPSICVSESVHLRLHPQFVSLEVSIFVFTLEGYDVLKRISDVISQSNRTLLEDLSSKFYTVIPHDFGFKKMREFVIDTPQKLKRKIEMVEALAEIEVATKLLEDNTKIQEDPLYYQYEQLRCKLIPVEIGSQEFQMIENYMKNTHAKTHSGYAANIVQVFRASREGETERFQKFFDTSNRMLLWHGSRLTNWAGILSQGLQIAPPEAPSTGYMFGKGVYFADMFSKSANYCFASSSARDGVLLLCEVALGDMNELLSANCNADKLPSGKLSTKGVGATAPDFEKAQVLEDGVIVPLGNPKEQPNSKISALKENIGITLLLKICPILCFFKLLELRHFDAG
ncbi:poly [ADP-ribose] polymerase 2-like, partial [Lycium barbarum]|uniref:poly [ADP-ribose] polymerase 2-like n=1 Tax=Lycium barbarum TaxID=112863 RepID=UPI00293E09FA